MAAEPPTVYISGSSLLIGTA